MELARRRVTLENLPVLLQVYGALEATGRGLQEQLEQAIQRAVVTLMLAAKADTKMAMVNCSTNIQIEVVPLPLPS